MTTVMVNYDYRDNIWCLYVEGEVMISFTDEYVVQKAEILGIDHKETVFKLMCFEHIMKGLRMCGDNALVKWFLTKTVSCGI